MAIKTSRLVVDQRRTLTYGIPGIASKTHKIKPLPWQHTEGWSVAGGQSFVNNGTALFILKIHSCFGAISYVCKLVFEKVFYCKLTCLQLWDRAPVNLAGTKGCLRGDSEFQDLDASEWVLSQISDPVPWLDQCWKPDWRCLSPSVSLSPPTLLPTSVSFFLSLIYLLNNASIIYISSKAI